MGDNLICFEIFDLYNDIQNTLKNKTENYIDDIITKTVRIFLNNGGDIILLNFIESVFIQFEKNENFLFL